MTAAPAKGGPAAPPAQQGAPPPRPPRGGGLTIAGWLRWGWRQLTSMRTALILLFLLALAAVPGSIIPQEGIDPAAVSQYYQAHPTLAPVLDRLGLFSVFGAPWFAAIYLLLFLSLAGCVLPRTVRLAGSARQQPPRAPRHLTRLPMAARYQTAMSPDDALASAAALLKGQRFRLRTGDGWVSAEKGYLREVGNLIFHLALLALLASVGLGGIFGYKANRLLISGQTFANTVTDLDQFRPGRLVTPGDLQPFTMSMTSFQARYVTSGPQRGQPITYAASVRYSAQPGAQDRSYLLRVNAPLKVDGVRVFLIGHGYAPVFKVTDGTGHVVFDQPVPFVPVEQNGLTSEGVIKVPDAEPDQLGFAGVFLPTAVDVGGQLASGFPAPLLPRVSLVSYAGNLGLDSGPAQSVYELSTAHLKALPVAPRPLAPGDSITLPGHRGTLTFTGYRQWISLAITYDPGQVPALLSAILAIAGLLLSFAVRRRRVFVRAAPVPGSTVPGSTVPGSTVPGSTVPGSTVVTVGGLARSDAAGGFETEFAELAGQLRRAHDGQAPAAAAPGPADDAVLRNDTLVLDDTELDAAAQAADDADDPGPAGGPGGSDPADPGPGAAASPDTESAEVHGPRHVPSAGE
jgi:cytochrome c biogenesis protein